MSGLFGPYQLRRRIGLGELSEVFVATHSKHQQPGAASAESSSGRSGHVDGPVRDTGVCAVKRIAREMQHDPEAHRLFAEEGALAARLHHPKVVRVFDVDDVEGRPYIAMEYVPGADLGQLRDLIAPERLSPSAVMRIAADVCDALAYIHGAADERGRPLGVVHGDLTPSNIMVSTRGEAKVIDFSVASSQERRSGDRAVRGTYAYMSPEQARGQPIDARTDLFALGVVLWELFAGRRLFRRQANYLTLTAVVEQPAPRLGELDDLQLDAAADELDRVLERALAKDRDARWSSAAELRMALQSIAEEHGWDMPPETLAHQVRGILS